MYSKLQTAEVNFEKLTTECQFSKSPSAICSSLLQRCPSWPSLIFAQLLTIKINVMKDSIYPGLLTRAR